MNAGPIQTALIRGGRVYDRAGDIHKPAVRDVIVEGDRIVAVEAANSQRVEELLQVAEAAAARG